ncbi:hypothetical protein MED222_05275 [Vibrio sp. MED222]|nr:hypothetical protein MED222_05275 [Vibrio sp. MED222]
MLPIHQWLKLSNISNRKESR